MNSILHLATVIAINDPDGRNRVQVSVINRPDAPLQKVWARVLSPYASDEAGIHFLPEIGDEVLVAFERGRDSEPIVLGSLFNGARTPPPPASSMGNGTVQLIKTAAGHEIVLHSNPKGGVSIRTKKGHRVEIDDGANTVRLATAGGASITIGASGVTISSSGKVKLDASVIEMNASRVAINAATVECSGVIKASTVITDSVVSKSYTPGAGNLY